MEWEALQLIQPRETMNSNIISSWTHWKKDSLTSSLVAAMHNHASQLLKPEKIKDLLSGLISNNRIIHLTTTIGLIVNSSNLQILMTTKKNKTSKGSLVKPQAVLRCLQHPKARSCPSLHSEIWVTQRQKKNQRRKGIPKQLKVASILAWWTMTARMIAKKTKILRMTNNLKFPRINSWISPPVKTTEITLNSISIQIKRTNLCFNHKSCQAWKNSDSGKMQILDFDQPIRSLVCSCSLVRQAGKR